MGFKPPPPGLTSPRTLLIVLLALSLVLGLTWLITIQRQSVSSQQALETVRIRSARIHNLDVLLLHTLDAESGVRSFLLSGNPAYLHAYQEAPAAITRALEVLRAESHPQRPARQTIERLGQLIGARMELLRRDVEQGRMVDASDADGGAGGAGKHSTDEIRAVLLELRERTLNDSVTAQEAAFQRFSDVRAINRVLGAGVLVLLLTLAVALFREERLRRQIAAMLSSENERLQAEVTARTHELNRLATYLTSMREAEQARVAEELHDELGILLTAARMDAGWLARKLPADAEGPLRSRASRLIDTIAQAISTKRKVVAELRPPLLADFGAIEAVRALTHSAASADTQVEAELPETLPALDPQVSLTLYRVAQEALANVRRHAQAGHIKLRLHNEDNVIVLRVEDDGVGFDHALPGTLRMGLADIGHRVRMLGGHLRVHSSPQHGTVVEARLPVTPA